ncbi:MAG: hypothetical protein WB783_10045 [Arenicellales bacterium]
MAKNKVVNPLTRFGIRLALGAMAILGIAALTGQDGIVSPLVRPLLFFCSLYFTAWIVFQYRTGEITLRQGFWKYTYTRKKHKVRFLLTIVIGFSVGAFLTVVLASDLLGCKWSLVNPC